MTADNNNVHLLQLERLAVTILPNRETVAALGVRYCEPSCCARAMNTAATEWPRFTPATLSI
jgi:hypothetical protein